MLQALICIAVLLKRGGKQEVVFCMSKLLFTFANVDKVGLQNFNQET